MDELDETFLNKYNTDHTTLSEDDFEKIMYQFESITKDKLPHIHLVSYFFFFFLIVVISTLSICWTIKSIY